MFCGCSKVTEVVGPDEMTLESLTVKSLKIVDSKGRVRASLGVSSKDMTALVLYDTEEKVRASLGVNENSASSLILYDAGGLKRVILGVVGAEQTTSMVMLTDGEGKPFVGLSYDDDLPDVFSFDANEAVWKPTWMRHEKR